MDIVLKIALKRSLLPEIGAQTFCYTLYGVTTTCCVSYQIRKGTQQGYLLVFTPPCKLISSNVVIHNICCSK